MVIIHPSMVTSGYYGACNEQHMMKELKNNGPIVVALNAPSDLF